VAKLDSVEHAMAVTAAQNSISDSMAESLIFIATHYDTGVNFLKYIPQPFNVYAASTSSACPLSRANQTQKERGKIDLKDFEMQTFACLQRVGKLKEPLDKLLAIQFVSFVLLYFISSSSLTLPRLLFSEVMTSGGNRSN